MTRRAIVILILAVLAPGAVEGARGDITLQGSLSLPNTVFVSDVWGIETGPDEYAIVGDWFGNKLFIIDVNDPANPFIAAEVPNVPGFDFKIWGNYIYSCDGSGGGRDTRIVDISDPLNPVVMPQRIFGCHNMSISSTGLLALSSPGLRLLNLAVDPLLPPLVFDTSGSGRSDGHDSTPHGNRLYDFGGFDPTYIWDVSTPSAPLQLGVIDDPRIVYNHSGDATPDGNYLVIADELAGSSTSDLTFWDITTPSAPARIATLNDANSSVHNIYIVDDIAYVSHYASGFKTIDVSDPANPAVLDTWDTSSLTGNGFIGAFGVYPFASSGLVYISDIDNGFFVFSVDKTPASPTSPERREPAASAIELSQNSPNPFNPATSIAFTMRNPGNATLTVYSVRGQRVRTLVDGHTGAGAHTVRWDGRDESGQNVASGTYFYRLIADGESLTRRMTLIK